MARVLLIGSGNRDKCRELQSLLEDSAWDVRSLGQFPETIEPVEDADTFEANAMLKARYYAAQFGVACVADDSGILVDALAGAPGVHSARYAGLNCSYDDNNRKLLRELAAIPTSKRTARFVCCAAFHDPDGDSFTEMGTCEGIIAPAPRGSNGFGYDPVFVPEGFIQTFGELEPHQKHAISHRGKAFRAIARRLATYAGAAIR